jgi:hypothetical protein
MIIFGKELQFKNGFATIDTSVFLSNIIEFNIPECEHFWYYSGDLGNEEEKQNDSYWNLKSYDELLKINRNPRGTGYYTTFVAPTEDELIIWRLKGFI